MKDDVVARVAFALQDDEMTRLRATRIARAALSALQVGDRLGAGLVVVQAISPETMVDFDRSGIVVIDADAGRSWTANPPQPS